MPTITATSRSVIARDSFGQFARELDRAGTATLRDMVQDGAKLAKRLAPKGKKRDPRYGVRLGESIIPIMYSDREGAWGSDLPYAMVRERGGAGWPISGNLNFWWENAPGGARRFGTAPGRVSTVWHPATAGTHYFEESYQAIMARWMQYARRHYPG